MAHALSSERPEVRTARLLQAVSGKEGVTFYPAIPVDPSTIKALLAEQSAPSKPRNPVKYTYGLNLQLSGPRTKKVSNRCSMRGGTFCWDDNAYMAPSTQPAPIIPDDGPDDYVSNFVKVGENGLLVDLNLPDYDDAEEPTPWDIMMEHGYEVAENNLRCFTARIDVALEDETVEFENLNEFRPNNRLMPRTLWHHQDNRNSEEHTKALAKWLKERLAEPTANDVLPNGGNYFPTTDPDV